MAGRSSNARLLLAAVVALGSVLPAGSISPAAAFTGPPTELLFWGQHPDVVYAGRPFEIDVAIIAFPEPGKFATVVTDGTSATITLGIESSPVSGATLECTSGLSRATATAGPDAGTVTFSGCTIDQVGEPYRLKATASNVVSTSTPTPVLKDAVSFPIRVAPEIDAPQDTIQVSISSSGTHPAVIWGDTVTVHVRFTVNGANKLFQLQQTTRTMTTWSKLAELATDASGNARFSYRPSVSTRFRVRFAGAPDLPMGTSQTPGFLLFSYAKQVPTHSTPKVIRRGTSVTIATTVRPLLPELAPARVWFGLYHRVSGSWTLASSRYVAVDSTGVARTVIKFGGTGEWYVRSSAVARWTPGMEGFAPATAWASRPTPIARYSVR